MSRKRKILLGIALFILLVLIFLPTAIKYYAINNSKDLIGRQIAIGKLKYNYFTSTVKVYNFRMFEQNEKDIFASFDTLIINFEPYKLTSGTKSIENLYLKGLMVKVILKDSMFNFDDLLAKFNTPEDSLNNPDIESEPFKYSLSNLQLKSANIYFDNRNVGNETHLEDLSFLIPFIGWDQKEKSNADVKFNLKNGGYIESSLNINPVDGSFDAAVKVKDLYLKPFYEYVKEYAEVNDFKGRLNSQIEIKGNTNEVINSIISGHVDVNDFVMTNKNDKEVLASKRIDCNLKKIDYANNIYVLDSLKFSQPYAYFEMDSITNNMFKIFKLDSYDDTSESSNLYYAINHLNVQNGILDYSDNLTGARFDYHLSEIKVNSDSIFSDSKWVNIYSDMLLNNRGTLNAKIGFDPSNTMNVDLDMTIENFLLSDINIYSKYYTGHNILKGDFYYYSQSKITNGDIKSENKLLVKNVTLSNEKGGLYSLPLKFAIFLLKDKNGDVNLEIPVRGDLNDPQISVGKIVWNTFKNLIVRAAAAPINLLAGLVGGDPKEFEEINFAYTDTIPSEKQFSKLDKLLEMETKKEGLKIELTHYVDADLQREAITMSELGKQYFRDTEKDYLKDENGFEMYIQTKVGNDSISIIEAASKLINAKTVDSIAIIYNDKLIKNTENYLKTSKDSTHITIKKSDLKEPDNIGSLSRFKIKYDMLDESNNDGDN